jgi:spore germination protein
MSNPFDIRSPMPDQRLELSAWLAPWNPDSLSSFESHASKLKRVYPVWYNLGDEGLAARRQGASGDFRKRVMELAGANQVEVWPLISNFNERLGLWDEGRVSRILLDPRCAASHMRQLIDLVKADGGQGINLDFEGMRPSDRKALSDFTALAYEACHKAGLKLAMAVHAKDAEPGAESGSASQDYAALSKNLDLMQLMAYDFHWSTSEAGSIAPPAWAGRVLKHALSLAEADRIEFGFPVYGYDWKGSQAHPLHWAPWEALVAKHGPALRDPETAELVLKYDGREAWYCDSVSILRKLLQARENGVGRAAFWVLGAEDPRIWEMLEDFPVPFLRA